MKKNNLIMNLSFDLALHIIDFCHILEHGGQYILSKQLLRSGTSIGSNIREAQNAESLSDFIHKMKISAKEIEETQYWLELCYASIHLPDPGVLQSEIQNVKIVTNTIISTCKKKQEMSKP